MPIKINKKISGYLCGLALCVFILLILFYALDFSKFYLATPNDARLQYIPFLDYARDTFLQSHQYPLWTWNITVGQSFFVDFAYYIMGSFTFYLSLLLQKINIFDIVSLTFMLKIILVYTGMYFFFHYNQIKPKIAILFSLITAFSYWYFNFTILYVTLTDFIIFVPLVLLGIDRLLKEKKIWMYAFALFGCLLANYVAFISVALLSLFYFCYRLFLSCESSKAKQKQFVRFLIISMLSCLLGAFMLLPVADSIFGSARIGNTALSLQHLFSINPLKGLNNLAYLAITSCPFLLLSCFLLFAKEKSKEKKVMIISLVLILILYVFNFFYYGTILFMYFSLRWLFVPFFLLTIITATLFNEYDSGHFTIKNNKLSFILSSLTYTALLMICYYFKILKNPSVPLIVPVIAMLMFICLFFYHHHKMVYLVMLVLLVFNLTIYNRNYLFHETKKNNGGGIAEKVVNDQYRYDFFEEALKSIKNKDKSNYRIQDSYSSQYNARNNLSMQYRYKGVQGYISVFNPHFLNWILEYGQVGQKMSLIQYDHMDNRSTLLDSWAVKYSVANVEQRVPDHFEFVAQFNNLVVYENKNFLNWGSVYSKAIGEQQVTSLSYIEKEILALDDTLILEKADNLPLDLSKYYQLLNMPNDFNKENGMSTFHFDAMDPGMIYLYLKAPIKTKNTYFEFFFSDPKVSNSGSMETYSYCNADEKCSGQRQEFLKYLGNNKANVAFDITSYNDYRLEKNEAYQFYWVDLNSYEQANQHYQKNQLTDVQITDTTFKATLNSDKSGYLQLAIPYNKGWKLKINGQPTETFKSNYAYLTAEVAQGRSNIELHYEVPYLRVGLIISGGALISLFLYGIILKKKKN